MSAAATRPAATIDWALLSLILLLLGFGLVMLTSASISVAENSTGQPFFYLQQQLLAVVVGLVVAGCMLQTPTEFWQRVAPLLLTH